MAEIVVLRATFSDIGTTPCLAGEGYDVTVHRSRRLTDGIRNH